MSPGEVDSSENLFNASSIDAAYWDTYLTVRPTYSPAFYERIYQYHSDQGNGKFSVAHDVGAGPGQVAGRVLSRVDKVHLSDVNEKHLDVARHYLQQTPGRLERTTFTCCSGTEIAESLPHDEADLVLVGESFALMDCAVALDNFARVLRPGGTVAIWYYGRPVFAEQAYAAECQKIYDKIVNKLFSSVIKGGSAVKQASWKRTTDVMASWFDSVDFPSAQWHNVERRKWNHDCPMTFYDDVACDFEATRSSKIDPNDTVVEQIDRSFWADQWTIEDVKDFVNVNLPAFVGNVTKDAEIEELYSALTEAMGGSTAKRDMAWPVVLLLATKR